MPDEYEFEITGTIGSIIASCLSELSAVAQPSRTVLTGSVGGPDDLHRVLDLLDAHGTPALDVRITYRDDGSAAPTAVPDRCDRRAGPT